jgi:transcriptional regulator with XRE-family HTH domain
MVPTQTEATGNSLARHIAREVRAEMARQGISQEALAERLGEGWIQKRVSRRLTGEVAIDLDELELIAAALGVPVAQFIPTPRAAA